MDILKQRLFNQRLAGNLFEQPEEAVAWLGAVQAQEYPGAKWGLAQRTHDLRQADFDRAFAEGRILRTHMLRPTWHFVTPADIRWLLKLTAPRVHALNETKYRKLNLDSAVFSRCHGVFSQALSGGRQLTRAELASELRREGINPDGSDHLRLAYMMMQAELDGLICSGAMCGKQHTYALLDERAPLDRGNSREEALAELVLRFFTSRGPATPHDFARWSGLPVSDAREGLEMVKARLFMENMNGKDYWFPADGNVPKLGAPLAHLLPAYDEYTNAYNDSSAFLDQRHLEAVIAAAGIVIVIDGRIVGSWKRTLKKRAVSLALDFFIPLGDAERLAVDAAVQRYGEFLGLNVILT